MVVAKLINCQHAAGDKKFIVVRNTCLSKNYSFTAQRVTVPHRCSWATEEIEYPKNGTFATLLLGAWTLVWDRVGVFGA